MQDDAIRGEPFRSAIKEFSSASTLPRQITRSVAVLHLRTGWKTGAGRCIPLRFPRELFAIVPRMSDTFPTVEAAPPWHGRHVRSSPGRMTLEKPDKPSRREALLGEEGLYAPLQALAGLGARGEELLTKLLAKPMGTPRVIDLLWHLPSGYLDRRLSPSIESVAPGGMATLLVTPVKYNAPPKGAARAPMRVVSEDESGTLDIVFFHGGRDGVKRLLPLHEPRLVSGRVEKYGSRLQMAHPDYILAPGDAAKLPAIEPIYPLTLGLTQKLLYRIMGAALARLPEFEEWLDASLVEAEGWPSFNARAAPAAQAASARRHRALAQGARAAWLRRGVLRPA